MSVRRRRLEQARPKVLGDADPFGQALTFALGPVLFGLLGRLADGALGTRPLWLVVGVLLGFVSGGATLYYRYKARIAELDAGRPYAKARNART